MVTIDLDTYEFRNNTPGLTGLADDHRDLQTDFQLLDAEIIDYGVSEDEMEAKPTTPKDPPSSSTASSAAHTQKQASVNVTNVTCTSKTKPLHIKVVDCDKYPWYYSKYKNQILRRKYFAAVEQARKIIKCIQSNATEPPITLDLEDFSDSSENLKSSIEQDIPDAYTRASTIDEAVYIDDKNIKLDKKIQKKISGSETIPTKTVVSNGQTYPKMIDFKMNKGLVGMKVQRISENDIRKETCTKKSQQQTRKSKKQKDKFSNEIFVITDATQMHEKPEKNKNEIKNVDKNSHKKSLSLKCSLQINSPKIMMKVKEMIPPQENNCNMFESNQEALNYNKVNEVGACLIANKNEDYTKTKEQQQPSNDAKKVKKYIPMPKSKRIAIEMNKDMNNKGEKLKNIEDKPNTKSEQLKIISTIAKSSTSFDKYSIHDEKLPKIYTMQKNKETSNQSFLYKNKFTEKVLKIHQLAPKNINQTSKTNHKKDSTKEKIRKSNEGFDHTKNQVQLLSKNVHNVSSRSKYDVTSMKHNELHMMPGLVSVAKQSAYIVTKKKKTEVCSAHCESSSMNKNMKSYNFSSSAQSNENNRHKNTLSNLSDITTTDNNLESSTKGLNEAGTRTILPKSPMICNSSATIKSSSHSFVNDNQVTSRKRVDKMKQSEYNLPEKDTNNIEEYRITVKDNRLNEINIQSTISSSHEPSESYEYILPNVVNSTLGLSDFHRGTVESSDSVIQNQLNVNNISQLITPSHDLWSSQQQYNSSTQNTAEYIVNDNTIGKEHMTNSVVNQNHILRNLNVSDPMRPPLTPVSPDATKKPKIIERRSFVPNPPYSDMFQKQPPPLPSHIRHRLNVPLPYGQMPCPGRSQSPIKQVHRTRFNPYQQSKFAYPPGSNVIHRSPWNDMHQNTGINFDYSNCIQKPIYNNLSYQEMLHNPHVPPGTCDVQPNIDQWPHNISHPTFTPPQQLTLPHCQTSHTESENTTIIGRNFTGLVKKINIPSTVDLNKCDKIDSKKAIKKQQLDSTDTHLPTDTKAYDSSRIQIFTHNNIDSTTSVSTKTDMMKEIEKTMTTVDTPVEPESKILNQNKPYKEQLNNELIGRSGPLSKKIQLDSEFTTKLQYTKKAPKIGYSPPILPIPTFQNILSEIQTAVLSTNVKETPPDNQPNTLKDHRSTFKRNNCKVAPKGIFQTKQKKKKERTEEDNIKKISLEEYKKRGLKKRK